MYEIHHSGITQMPRDHLFKKSGHLGATCVLTGKQSQIDKFENKFFMGVTKYLTKYVILVNLFTLYVIHHIGITQRPRDHLIYKSGHLSATCA